MLEPAESFTPATETVGAGPIAHHHAATGTTRALPAAHHLAATRTTRVLPAADHLAATVAAGALMAARRHAVAGVASLALAAATAGLGALLATLVTTLSRVLARAALFARRLFAVVAVAASTVHRRPAVVASLRMFASGRATRPRAGGDRQRRNCTQHQFLRHCGSPHSHSSMGSTVFLSTSAGRWTILFGVPFLLATSAVLSCQARSSEPVRLRHEGGRASTPDARSDGRLCVSNCARERLLQRTGRRLVASSRLLFGRRCSLWVWPVYNRLGRPGWTNVKDRHCISCAAVDRHCLRGRSRAGRIARHGRIDREAD